MSVVDARIVAGAPSADFAAVPAAAAANFAVAAWNFVALIVAIAAAAPYAVGPGTAAGVADMIVAVVKTAVVGHVVEQLADSALVRELATAAASAAVAEDVAAVAHRLSWFRPDSGVLVHVLAELA